MYRAFQAFPCSFSCHSEKARFIFTRLKGIWIMSIMKQSASMWVKAIISSRTLFSPSAMYFSALSAVVIGLSPTVKQS